MPTPNQTEREPFTIDITPNWNPILVHTVTALFESWAKPADEDWTNTQRTAARKAAIDTLTDAAQKLDGANAALAVAVEEINAAWDTIAELPFAIPSNDNAPSVEEWITESRANAVRLVQEAAKGEQASECPECQGGTEGHADWCPHAGTDANQRQERIDAKGEQA
jgi:hypothetical protein